MQQIARSWAELEKVFKDGKEAETQEQSTHHFMQGHPPMGQGRNLADDLSSAGPVIPA